jgi:hypothetical protein
MDTIKRLKAVDPKEFGLSNRVRVAVDRKKNYYIVKNIKSRIIMKTGKKINKTAKTIKTKKNKSVILATTAPVCSKTEKYLKDKQIDIVKNYFLS